MARRPLPSAVAFFALHCVAAIACAQFESPTSINVDAKLATLQQLVAQDPTHADTWRLIGRVYREQNRHVEAYQAFKKAISLEPANVAAHFDMGELFELKGNAEKAREHFEKVIQLAPESQYAQQLINRDAVTAPSSTPRFVAQAQWTQSVASDSTTDGLTFPIAGAANLDTGEIDFNVTHIDNVRMIIEGGAVYSTNVSLAPTSRELTPSQASGFQGFLSPHLEWIPVQRGQWRAGPSFNGYFTLNENQFRSLDIASFQPGLFLERDALNWMHGDFTTRLDYSYTLDLIGNSRFGDRHQMTASAVMTPSDSWSMRGFVGVSWADFTDDGANPATDSLDGSSFIVGLSRTRRSSLLAPAKTLGFDYESVNTQGADFRYNAVTVRGSTTFQLTRRLQFITNTGIGFRHYGDFTGTLNRDELTLRGGARLQWKLRDDVLLSTVIDHNRFLSINEAFDTERTEAGVTVTFVK